MNLYAHEALPAVVRRLVSGLRWLWPDRQDLSVSKSLGRADAPSGACLLRSSSSFSWLST
jgi:hypothetical protein